MTETDRSNAELELISELVRLADEKLAESPAVPGRAYQPIELPLSWLFGKTGQAKILGYRQLEQFWPPPDTYVGGGKIERAESEIDKYLAQLQSYGVKQTLHSPAAVGGWVGNLWLDKYSPAQLNGRRVLPADGQALYVLAAERHSSDGRGPSDLLDYLVFAEDGSHQAGVLDVHQEGTPITRALGYLRQA